MSSGFGSGALQCHAADHDGCITKHPNPNVSFVVDFPAEFARFDQSGKRPEIFIQPCRFILNVTEDVGLHVLVRREALDLFGVSLNTGLQSLRHGSVEFGFWR